MKGYIKTTQQLTGKLSKPTSGSGGGIKIETIMGLYNTESIEKIESLYTESSIDNYLGTEA